MSLSNATWQEFSRASNLQETWVVHLYYDAAGASDYLEISDRDFMDGGVQALGVIQSMGEIRREIDLMKYTASVDNMTITLANVVYHGAPLADELKPGSTRKYQNRKVQIYSILNGNAATKMQIYNGRLMGMSWTADEITLEIEQAQPWDFLESPLSASDVDGKFVPRVYGVFTNNASLPDSKDYVTGNELVPLPIQRLENDTAVAYVQELTSTIRAHYYEPNYDVFVPITDLDNAYSADSVAHGDYQKISTHWRLKHGWKWKPTGSDYVTDFTNEANAYDVPDADDSSTYAEVTVTVSLFGMGSEYLGISIPFVSQKLFHNTEVVVTYSATETGTITSRQAILSWTGSSNTETIIADGTIRQATLSFPTAQPPSDLLAGVYIGGTDGSTLTFRLYDVVVEGTVIISDTSDELAQAKAIDDVEKLYYGGIGEIQAWDGVSAVETVPQLHRQFLHTLCGHTTAPENYSALDSARTLWTVRWWLHEQEPVKDLLEQAQFEGAFVFIWSMTTTGTGRYLFVKSSYTSSDVVATLNDLRDTTGITYSHAPFSDLITKQSIRYQRHPAEEGRYISSYDFTNSTSRTAWNIQADENVESVELDMLVAEVDTWAEIRDSIVGDLKQIVECDIINPLHFIVEIGDVIQIENDSRYYMVVGERRTPGRLSITAREVYA